MKKENPEKIFDIRKNAELAALHYLNNFDVRNGYPYFWIELYGIPPRAWHYAWDYCDALPRYLQSLAMIRQMTGRKDKSDREILMEGNLLNLQNPEDGLFYRKESNWSLHEAELFDQFITLTAILSLFMEKQDEKYLDVAEKCANGLIKIATHCNSMVPNQSYAFFESYSYTHGNWNYGIPLDDAYYGGGSHIREFAKLFELTGKSKYKDFANRLVNFITKISKVFYPDGSFPAIVSNNMDGHFHSRAETIMGILSFGEKCNDSFSIDFAEKAYNWGKSIGTSFGWFPEIVGYNDVFTTCHSETCVTVDMMNIACGLARTSNVIYWDDLEKFGVNYLIASQIKDSNIIRKYNVDFKEKDNETFKNIEDIILGGFHGRFYPNDLIMDMTCFVGMGILIECCGGAGGRGLYLLWENAVKKMNKGSFINLYLTRITKDLRVISYFPKFPKIEIESLNKSNIFLRKPGWLDKDAIEIKIKEKTIVPVIRNGYFEIGEVNKGEKIDVSFKVSNLKEEEISLGRKYNCEWMGNYMVNIEPKGRRLSPGYGNVANSSLEEVFKLNEIIEPSIIW